MKNPNTPSGKGLKVEYFSDKNLNTSISSKIASPEQNSIPKGTNSIRWSGAFETLEGEEYYLYITTPDKISIYINDRSVEPTKHDIGKQEYEFKYELIPSHKNNILIETKGKSPLKLSWSSKNTPKETIPITSLYPEKSY